MPKILEAHTANDLVFNSLNWIDLSFGSNHHIYFINIWACPQKFF